MTTNTSENESKFVLDVRPLGRAAGNHHHIDRVFLIDEPIGLDLIAIPAGSPVSADLELEAVTEGILVTGVIAGPTTGQCVNCLSEIHGTVEASLTELFVYPDSETANTIQDDDEVYVLDDPTQLDLEQAIIDAVCLALPFAPSCSSVEGHPCPEDAEMPEIDGVSGEDNDLIDPRWAALEEFQNLAFLNDAATEPTADDTDDASADSKESAGSEEKKER